MSWYQNCLSLFAQQIDAATDAPVEAGVEWYWVALIVLASVAFPFVIGSYVSNSLRMPDHGWKIGVILCSIFSASVITYFGWPPQLGIDLRGGVILVYEVKEDQDYEMPLLIQALKNRINPGGVKEVVIRPYGNKQVEIIIPEIEKTEVNRIKRMITKMGILKFRIVANRNHEQNLFDLAREQDDAALAEGRRPSTRVLQGGELMGEWVYLGPAEGWTENAPVYKVQVQEGVNLTRELEPGRRQVLMAVQGFNIHGDHLSYARPNYDQSARPCIDFGMKGSGAHLFQGLTANNIDRRLGIIMDENLLSAPNINSAISDRGQITGDFSQEEVDEIAGVLKAGKLPAALVPQPISESEISPTLGHDTIQKGQLAISISLAAVLVFMVLYYRFAGMVAALALTMNLLLILALMILIKAALTLPGLAGLVLTVGMSVDANVLIFERIREEIKRGSALRLAIRNGFGRATTTIVDANLTTLITAVVLYTIGTDQIRGFAVTLILGILMSMFTAIFCSRVLFDIAEKRRWISKLSMAEWIGRTHLDFIGKRRIAAAVSLVVIIVGLVGTYVRGTGMFDIDFNGGYAIEIRTTEELSYDEVRQRVSKEWSVFKRQVRDEDGKTRQFYKFDTPTQDVQVAQASLKAAFTDESGNSLLEMNSLSFTLPTVYDPAGAAPDLPDFNGPGGELPGTGATEPDAGSSDTGGTTGSDDPREAAPNPPDPTLNDATGMLPGDAFPQTLFFGSPLPGEPIGAKETETLVAFAGDDLGLLLAQADESEATAADDTGEPGAVADENSSSATEEEPAAAGPDAAAATEDSTAPSPEFPGIPGTDSPDAKPAGHPTIQTQSTLMFSHASSDDSIRMMIDDARTAADMLGVNVIDVTPMGDSDTEWLVTLAANPDEAASVLTQLKSSVDGTPALLSSNKIGSQIAGDMREKAIAALLVSLLGIVAYIWIRFQRVIYGLAAVIALVHDVLVTLGALALSFWLADYFGFLLISEFKISLPIVAAFLTIIGYSLNDTIVVFDRIREVKGKSPDITTDIINTSINQTLGRTVLTSLTTLLVVGILYIGGGDSIHGFAFALVVGVMAGTYSSIFVASPALLWMSRSSSIKPIPRGADSKRAKASAT